MQKTLTDWFTKGYRVKSATVSFIVAWKPKDAPKEEPETAVLLADLTLTLWLKIQQKSGFQKTEFTFSPLFREAMKKLIFLIFFTKKRVNFWKFHLLSRKLLIINNNTIVYQKARGEWQITSSLKKLVIACKLQIIWYFCLKYLFHSGEHRPIRP